VGRRGSGRSGKAGNGGGNRRRDARGGSNKASGIENGSGWLDMPHRRRTRRPWVITSRIRELFFGDTCDRPGCYESFKRNRRSPLQRFCSHDCRRALERVLERERRWSERGQGDAQARSLATRSASLRL
jgi:hypothetical protein